MIFVDRLFRLPRIWSNQELIKFAHLFRGDIVNVSGWKDIDKEGRHYRDYFINADSYSITNYKSEIYGFQGYKNEIFLDLEDLLPPKLLHRYDVVFNHTTLEHIFNVQNAFSNLCKMSKDVVIIVVPFLQPYHTDYGDYWRFTPSCISRLFNENGYQVLYLSFNDHPRCSVYIFTIASKNPLKWNSFFNNSSLDHKTYSTMGYSAIPNKAHNYHNKIVKPLVRIIHRFNIKKLICK